MGGFQFQESHLEMVMHGVPVGEEDILPNLIDIDTMKKSSRGIPFKGGHEMHVYTLRVLIHLCNFASSLIVNMNSSTGMSY